MVTFSPSQLVMRAVLVSGLAVAVSAYLPGEIKKRPYPYENHFGFQPEDVWILNRHAHIAYQIAAETGWDADAHCDLPKKYTDFPGQSTGVPYIGCRCNNLLFPDYDLKQFRDVDLTQDTAKAATDCPLSGTPGAGVQMCSSPFGPDDESQPCTTTNSHVDAFGAKTMNSLGLIFGQFLAHGLSKHKAIPGRTVTGTVGGVDVTIHAVEPDDNINCPYLDQDQTYGSEKTKAPWVLNAIYLAADQYAQGGPSAVDMYIDSAEDLKEDKKLSDVNKVVETFFAAGAGVPALGCFLPESFGSLYNSPRCTTNPSDESMDSFPPIVYADMYGHVVPVFKGPAFFGVQATDVVPESCLFNGRELQQWYIPSTTQPSTTLPVISESDCRLAAFDFVGASATVDTASNTYYAYLSQVDEAQWEKRCLIFSSPVVSATSTATDSLPVTQLLEPTCADAPATALIVDNMFVKAALQGRYGVAYERIYELLSPMGGTPITKAPLMSTEHLIDDHKDHSDRFFGDARGNSNPMLSMWHEAWDRDHNIQYRAVKEAYGLTARQDGLDDYYMRKYMASILGHITRLVIQFEYQVFAVDVFWASTLLGLKIAVPLTASAEYDARMPAETSHLFRWHTFLPRELALRDQANIPLTNLIGKACSDVASNGIPSCREILEALEHTPVSDRSVQDPVVGVEGGARLDKVNNLRTRALGFNVDGGEPPFSDSAIASLCPLANTAKDRQENYSALELQMAAETGVGMGFIPLNVQAAVSKYILSLQNGDRFYYVPRTRGQRQFEELEGQDFCGFARRAFGPHAQDITAGHCMPDANVGGFETAMSTLTEIPLHDAIYRETFYKPALCFTEVTLKSDGSTVAWSQQVDVWDVEFTSAMRELAIGEDHFMINCPMAGGEGPWFVMTGKGDDSIYCGDDQSCTVFFREAVDHALGSDQADQFYLNGAAEVKIHGRGGNDWVECSQPSILVGVMGDGNDYVNMYDCLVGSATFAGDGDDITIIHQGQEVFGGVGDDIVISYGLSDIALDQGYIGENSITCGNDLMIHMAERGDVDAECGHDMLKLCSNGNVRFSGDSGYDGVTCKCDRRDDACTIDLSNIVLQNDGLLGVATNMARLGLVEYAAGSPHGDIMKGTSAGLARSCADVTLTGRTVDDPLRFEGPNLHHCADLDHYALTHVKSAVEAFGTVADNFMAPFFDLGWFRSDLLLGGGDDDLLVAGLTTHLLVDGAASLDVTIKFENDDVKYEEAESAEFKDKFVNQGLTHRIHREYIPAVPGATDCDVFVVDVGLDGAPVIVEGLGLNSDVTSVTLPSGYEYLLRNVAYVLPYASLATELPANPIQADYDLLVDQLLLSLVPIGGATCMSSTVNTTVRRLQAVDAKVGALRNKLTNALRFKILPAIVGDAALTVPPLPPIVTPPVPPVVPSDILLLFYGDDLSVRTGTASAQEVAPSGSSFTAQLYSFAAELADPALNIRRCIFAGPAGRTQTENFGPYAINGDTNSGPSTVMRDAGGAIGFGSLQFTVSCTATNGATFSQAYSVQVTQVAARRSLRGVYISSDGAIEES